MVKARWTLLTLAVAAVTLVPATALATHMSNYGYNPVEHDDQGRSYEPDFQSTGVLGVPVANCIVSLNLAPACVPDTALAPPGGQSPLLAPGCTDDAGRQPSGLCGLYTIGAGNANAQGVGVPPGTVGVSGMSGNAAPGRLTPSKGSTIRFLDSRVDFQHVPPAGGSQYIDVNSKLLDSGVAATLAGLDPNLGGAAIMPGSNALWAWYGYWTDKNGNGVVDHLRSATECTGTSCPPSGGVADTNEFVWIGKCVQFNGQAAPPGQAYCSFEADTLMPTWVYPGNHHAFSGACVNAPECGLVPGDLPGRELFHYATGPCPGEDCVEFIEDSELYFYGDPIFGEQESRRVDTNAGSGIGVVWGMGDRTGEALSTGRQWVFGNGFAAWFYDQSLLVSTIVVTGVTTEPAIAELETDFDLTKLSSSDVDVYQSWNPTAEALLMESVKPAARSGWVTVREVIAASDAAAELNRAIPGTRLTYDECDPYLGICLGTYSARVFGGLDDRIFSPGFAKEPNTGADVFPGASRGECSDAFETWQGQCNDYSAHAGSPHAWLDHQEFNAIYTSLAWRTPIGNCVICVTGPPSGTVDLPDGLRDEGEYYRVLDPGTHVFFGNYGAWTDLPQVHDEETLDLLGTLAALQPVYRTETYTVGPDGWIGSIVNTTGYSRVGGFLPEECTVYGVTGTFEYAQCHPMEHGNDDDNQNYGSATEWVNAEPSGGEGPLGHWLLRLTPEDGCWSVPVIVWRQFDTWTIGDQTAINDFTGQCATITMDLGNGANGGFVGKDVLILPQGNMGETVISEVAGIVTATRGGETILSEFVRDVDVYQGWLS